MVFLTSLEFCQVFASIQKLLAQLSDVISAATLPCFLCLLFSITPSSKNLVNPSYNVTSSGKPSLGTPERVILLAVPPLLLCLFINVFF